MIEELESYGSRGLGARMIAKWVIRPTLAPLAVFYNGSLGDGSLPWKLPKDLSSILSTCCLLDACTSPLAHQGNH